LFSPHLPVCHHLLLILLPVLVLVLGDEESLIVDWVVVGHHLAYDLELLGIVPPEDAKLHDTMVVDYLQRLARDDDRTRRGYRKLSDLVRLPGKGTTQLSFRAGVPLTDEQRAYLQADVEAVATVYRRQVRQRIPGGHKEVTLQVRAAMACSRMTRTGLPLNRGEIGAQTAQVQRRRRDAARVLREVGLHVPEQIGPRGGRKRAHLNTRVMRCLVHWWHIELGQEPPRTDGGKIAIDKDVLSGFQDRVDGVAWKEYVDADKMLGTFLEGLSGRGDVVHPNYRSMLRSGRTSCSDPNLQQVPSRDWRGQLKRCFVAPRGRVLYELDYAQLELCALAYVTKGRLKELINAGVDVHRHLGSLYFQKPAEEVTKHERFLMKAVSFGGAGGMGIPRLRKHIRSFGLADPGAEGARRLRDAWLAAFPEMHRFLEDSNQYGRDVVDVWRGLREADGYPWQLAEEIEAKLRADGCPLPAKLAEQLSRGEGSPELERWLVRRRVTIPPGGRTRHPVSYSEQHNTIFQGLAANLCKLALARVVLEYEPAWVHTFVHDSLLISVEEAEQERVVDEVMDIMLAAAADTLPGIRCGVEAVGPGNSWFEAKEGGERKKFV